MKAFKLLAIVVVTTAVTLLCIRSGQAMAKSPIFAGTVYHHTTDNKPETQDSGKLLAVTTTAALNSFDSAVTTTTSATIAAASVNASAVHSITGTIFAASINESTVDPIAVHERNESRATVTAVSNRTATEIRTPKNRTTVDHVQAVSRSLNNRMNYDDRFGHGSSTSSSRSQPAVVRGKLIKTMTYPSSHLHNDSAPIVMRRDENDDEDANDYVENGGAKVVVDSGTHHASNRPYYRHMTHDDYSTIDTDISVAEEDGSAGYHNLYDLTYNAVGNQKAPGTGWNSMGPTNGNGMPPGRLTHGSYPYVANYKKMPRPPSLVNHNNFLPPNMNYQIHHPNSQVEQYNIHNPLQQIQMIYEKADWRKIGILVFLKLGLMKLKLFSFLKLLFLLVFKLKLFLIAMFFKFLLIAKLMKFFKLLMLPLLSLAILPLLTTVAPMLIGGVLSIPNRLIELLTEPVLVPAANAITKNSAADPTVLPSATSAAAKTSSSTVFKIDDLSLVDRRRLNTLELYDPSMNIFRKVLELDKCVERIACRIAVVEKAGIMPMWINWMLQRVSKFIPSGKLKLYLKTYDDVNNVIYSESKTPENWASWCLERYTCDKAKTANVTNVMDSKQ